MVIPQQSCKIDFSGFSKSRALVVCFRKQQGRWMINEVEQTLDDVDTSVILVPRSAAPIVEHWWLELYHLKS
jgi:hypothetical protein